MLITLGHWVLISVEVHSGYIEFAETRNELRLLVGAVIQECLYGIKRGGSALA